MMTALTIVFWMEQVVFPLLKRTNHHCICWLRIMSNIIKHSKGDKKTAVVSGHICLDVFPDMGHLPDGQFESLFRPGHLISVGQAGFSTGGPVSNVGLALHHLGIPTKLNAMVGDDPYGRIVLEIIGSKGKNLLKGLRVDPDEPTSYSIIISPPGVDRIFLHCPGVNNTFSAKDIDQDLIAQADLFHFGYPPIMRQIFKHNGAELVTIFQQAKDNGITTSLDMAFQIHHLKGEKSIGEVY